MLSALYAIAIGRPSSPVGYCRWWEQQH